MDPRTIGRLIALGRVALGAALVAAPERIGKRWVGGEARGGGAQVILAAVGARDLALGLGTAWALGGGDRARPWLLASMAADATDLVASLRHRDALSPAAVAGLVVLAGGSAALGAWIQSEVE